MLSIHSILIKTFKKIVMKKLRLHFWISLSGIIMFFASAKAQSFQGCANASPLNHITTSDVYSICENNPYSPTKQYRTFTNHVNPVYQTTLSQCGELTPDGWVNTKMIGFCGSPIQNSYPTQIGPNTYQLVSQAVIRREIFKIQGLWPGYYLNVSGQFPVAGWATNNIMEFERVGDYRFMRRTIVKVEGLWPGYELNTVGEFPANGWINMQFGYNKLGADGFFYYTRATKKISGLPTGTIVNSCGDSYNFQIPAGWVTIEKNYNCASYTGVSKWLGRTLKNLNGLPVGSTEWVVEDDPIPAGWVIDTYQGKQYAYSYPGYPSWVTVYKVFIRKQYSAAKAPSGVSEEEALALENAEVSTSAPVQEEGRKPTKEELEKISQPLKITVTNNPSNSSFNLSIKGAIAEKKYTLMVYDINGKTIESQFVQLNDGQILTIGAGYTKGMYVAKITDGRNSGTVKLIKL
jgi:hypothetical protein